MPHVPHNAEIISTVKTAALDDPQLSQQIDTASLILVQTADGVFPQCATSNLTDHGLLIQAWQMTERYRLIGFRLMSRNRSDCQHDVAGTMMLDWHADLLLRDYGALIEHYVRTDKDAPISFASSAMPGQKFTSSHIETDLERLLNDFPRSVERIVEACCAVLNLVQANVEVSS